MNNFNTISQEQFEQIERYYNGSMEAEEKLEFNAKLQNDAVFASLVEEVKETLLGIESSALSGNLNTFHQEIEGIKTFEPLKKKNNNWLLGLAAAIAIILGSTWYMNMSSPSEKLYAKYYTPDPGLPTTMSSNDNFEFYDAMVNYKREEYAEAITKWEAILPKKPTNDTLNYFLGVANLAEGNKDNALTYLTIAINNQQSFLKSDAYYYIGLIHLKENNIELAKQNFLLSESDKAKQILSELTK